MCTFWNFKSSEIRTRIVHWIWRGFTESDEGSLNLTRVHWISRGFEHLKSRFCGNLTRWKLKQVIKGKQVFLNSTIILYLIFYSNTYLLDSNSNRFGNILGSSIKDVRYDILWKLLRLHPSIYLGVIPFNMKIEVVSIKLSVFMQWCLCPVQINTSLCNSPTNVQSLNSG